LWRITRILVPIDGSNCSLNAARYEIKVAKVKGSQVFCVHAIATVPGCFQDGFAAEMYIEDSKKQARAWFNKIINILKEKNARDHNHSDTAIRTDILIDVNSIVEAIVNYATYKNIDLIVIGTRGRSGIKGLSLGSVARGVAQHAECPVLFVREKKIFIVIKPDIERDSINLDIIYIRYYCKQYFRTSPLCLQGDA
jgi:nucleotide-binding universal stress UspA family protein